MSEVLARWNQLSPSDAEKEILSCCGSSKWAREMAEHRPLPDESSAIAASEEICLRLETQDWMEAFSKHPRIGERKAPAIASALSASWSAQEQGGAAAAADEVQAALAEGNRQYERKFERVFIVCATGKSASEMLQILRRRLQNDYATELSESAEEQRKITNLRLKKWLAT